MPKNPISTYLAQINEFFISLVIKSVTESRVFNIHKMGGPYSHLVFSPKKNSQELQLHQTILFSEFWRMSRS